MAKDANFEEEEMTVELELENGEIVNCAVITILAVDKQDYIALLPLDESGENEDGEVWFYRYSENPKDPNEEPELGFIEEDAEYDKVAEAFDEYLDTCEFDEIVDSQDCDSEVCDSEGKDMEDKNTEDKDMEDLD